MGDETYNGSGESETEAKKTAAMMVSKTNHKHVQTMRTIASVFSRTTGRRDGLGPK